MYVTYYKFACIYYRGCGVFFIRVNKKLEVILYTIDNLFLSFFVLRNLIWNHIKI